MTSLGCGKVWTCMALQKPMVSRAKGAPKSDVLRITMNFAGKGSIAKRVRCRAMEAYTMAPPWESKAEVTAILQEYKGDSPMYDLNDRLKEQMSLPLDVTFSDLKSQVTEMGDGTWKVFHAPHLVKLSRFFFATVNPVQYRLAGKNIYSNVKFIHPLLGTMWLSASGTMEMTDKSMDIVFDKFWVDVGAENLRESIDAPGRVDKTQETWDNVISWMGRVGFIRPLAVFPVLYFDEDFCVFRFPPLASNIAVTKQAA